MTASARKFCVIAFAALSVVPCLARPARAQDNVSCIEPFERAQRLRKEGKLLASGEALIACSQPSCAAFIAKECAAWYGEVQQSLPSVVVSAKQGDQPVRDVRVYLDGQLLSNFLTGRAVSVDPGVHEFKMERAGSAPVVVQVLVVEGEKNKLISAEFASQPSTPREPPTRPAERGQAETAPSKKPAIAAYIVGGAGLLAIGGGVALRLMASAEYDDLVSSCKPQCEQDEVDRLDLKYTYSDIALGVGGAALIAAGVLFVVNGSSSSEDRSAISVRPLARHGLSANWLKTF